MNKKGLIKVLFISLLALLIGIVIYFALIQIVPRIPNTNPSVPPTVSLQNLQAAPEKIVINNSEYTLSTFLWRDFMPLMYSNGGSSLMTIVEIKSPGKTTISSEIDATRLWIVKGKEIWEAGLTEETRFTTGDTLGKINRSGPRWGPEITVDVIVRVIDLKSGKEYLLKAPNQIIVKTS